MTKRRLIESLRAGTVRLAKDTSNLYRDYKDMPVRVLKVRDFMKVILVDVEGVLSRSSARRFTSA